MQSTTKHFKLYEKSIRELYHDLIRIGVLPPMKLNLKKSIFEQQSITLTISDQERANLFSAFELL